MRSIYLQPNSPRSRMEYVVRSMPQVADDTAYVVAHTVGSDRNVFRVFRERPDPSLLPALPTFFRGDSHPYETLIVWVAQQLAATQRAIRKGQKSADEYEPLVTLMEAKLPQIAVWVEHTKPNLSAISWSAALAAASEFELPESTEPVPQGEVLYQLSNGWTLQNLTTPEQIFAEGLAVQNCLRESQHGRSYAAGVKRGTTQIMSLRSPEGRPAVSIEYLPKRKRFVQIYAKQNTPLGATLESLKENKDGEALWRAIQKYKPMMREIIMNKFDGNEQGLVLADLPLPEGIKKIDRIDFGEYTCRLPDSVESIGRVFSLGEHRHPLPASLKRVESIALGSHNQHELPSKLRRINILRLEDYPFPVRNISVKKLIVHPDYEFPIDGIKDVEEVIMFSNEFASESSRAMERHFDRATAGTGSVSAGVDSKPKYKWPIPAHFDLTKLKRLDLGGYDFPLPKNLKSFNGSLYLDGYDRDLPAGLRSVNALYLGSYQRDLPPSLTTVKENLDLVRYEREFPATIKKAKLVTTVPGVEGECPYPFEVPAGFRTNVDEVRATATTWESAQERRDARIDARRGTGAKAGSKRAGIDPTLPESLRALQHIQLNQPIPEGTITIGFSNEQVAEQLGEIKERWQIMERIPSISLVGYAHPLPSTLKNINATVSLYGYKFPLPESLERVAGEIKVECYDFPLPSRLQAALADFSEYAHPIPLSIALYSDIRLQKGSPRLPSNIKEMAGNLTLFMYTHYLPDTLERVGGELNLQNYRKQLPIGLKSIGGSLLLSEVSAPLPDSLESVGESISWYGYEHPLPNSLKFVGGKISLEGYTQPLPAGLIPVGGYEDTRGYPHDIPGQPPRRRAVPVQQNPVYAHRRTSRRPVRRTSRGRKTSRR